jgi:hypothetical protein
MATNPSVANLTLILDAPQTVSESSEPKPTSLFQKFEAFFDRAFGDDEQTIANSIRWF